MSLSEGLISDINSTAKFFRTTTSVFDEADSTFAPQPELYTVAGHIAHAADSIDWFIEGGFGKGWDMDFPAMIAKAVAVTSLSEARGWFDDAIEKAVKVVGAASDAELLAPIGDDRIMPGAPRKEIISGITDHTAHHRGSLAVYARLVGKVPPMVYS